VYDVTHEASFNNIRKWIQDVHTYAEQSVNIVLIGNKCDLENKRAVDTERGQALADEYDIKFFETSAKTDHNVQQAFGALVAMVADRVLAGGTGGQTPTNTNGSSEKRKSTINVNDVLDNTTKKTGCC